MYPWLHPAVLQNLVGLIPLALLLGEVTEDLALRLGETIGGLLNATFGEGPSTLAQQGREAASVCEQPRHHATQHRHGHLLVHVVLFCVTPDATRHQQVMNAHKLPASCAYTVS